MVEKLLWDYKLPFMDITFRVPQGSALGPFILYINYIYKVSEILKFEENQAFAV